MHACIQILEWFFWTMFLTGLIATMYFGMPYVVDGTMSVSELVDVCFRVNCHLSFPVRLAPSAFSFPSP